MVGKLVNNAAESFLAIDGSVQNKQHSKSTGLVKKQCSGAVGGLVRGIGVVNLVHGDGQEHRPIGHRIHDNTAGGKTNARKGRWERPFQGRADQRGCGQRHPAKTVPFDGWCAAWGNLQLANPLKLAFHATLKSNRLVGLTKEGGCVHPNETGWTPERLKAGVVVKLNAHTGHWKSAFQGQAVQAGCPKRRHWLARHQWA